MVDKQPACLILRFIYLIEKVSIILARGNSPTQTLYSNGRSTAQATMKLVINPTLWIGKTFSMNYEILLKTKWSWWQFLIPGNGNIKTNPVSHSRKPWNCYVFYLHYAFYWIFICIIFRFILHKFTWGWENKSWSINFSTFSLMRSIRIQCHHSWRKTTLFFCPNPTESCKILIFSRKEWNQHRFSKF